jgi:thiamine-monophosphate kinase
MKITEPKIINNYLKILTFNNKNSLNLEDDVFYDPKKKIIFSTDTFEENVHFLNAKNPKTFVKKIFRSAISDIISKGTQPFTYFLSLSLNRINKKWLTVFKNELAEDSKKFSIFLGGGDTVKSKNLCISISVLGYVEKKPVLRSGAKTKDDIYITGNLGDAYVGLQVLLKKVNLGKHNMYYKKCFEEPKLSFKFSKYLNKFASSSMDISDGLIKDANSLSKTSKCELQIDFSKLPFSKKTQFFADKKELNLLNIFSRGDDYQILFTASKKYRPLIAKTAKQTSTKVTLIGLIKPGRGVKIAKENKIIKLSGNKSGYIHTF